MQVISRSQPFQMIQAGIAGLAKSAKPKLKSMAFLASVVMLPIAAGHAAQITWQSPVNDTGNLSDFVTTGTLFDAVTSNPTLTVDGITFNGQSTYSAGTQTFSNSQITITGLATGDYYTSGPTSPPPSWDTAYRTLLDQGSDNANTNGTTTIHIVGLTVGQQYTLQIFQPFWDANWATGFSDGINSSALVYSAGADGGRGAASDSQYLIGTFTADSSTEAITLHSPTADALFDAIQVRTAGGSTPVPEPSALLIFATSVLALTGAQRLRSRRKTA